MALVQKEAYTQLNHVRGWKGYMLRLHEQPNKEDGTT